MIFLDFEASDGVTGFPIEVGFCVVSADRSFRSAAKIIRHDEWLDDFSRWNPMAEGIHHISRATIMELGEAPAMVMAWLNQELAGQVACCDSPMDKLWLDELESAAGVARTFGLVDITAAFEGPEISEMAYQHALAHAHIVTPKTHRADVDSEHLATCYLLSLNHGAQVHRLVRDLAAPGGYQRVPA